jgi:inner membrane protein
MFTSAIQNAVGPLSAGQLPWAVGALYLLAALLGGVAPDLDKPGRLWSRVLVRAALGGHRHLSHSVLGFGLAAALVWLGLAAIAPLVTFPPGLLWLGFAAGYLSHLAMDTLTVEGVPWLYPLRHFLGMPPIASLRVRTGGWVEQLVVTPALLALIGWIGYRAGGALAVLWN